MTMHIKKQPSDHKQEAENALIKLADQLHLMEQKISTVNDERLEKSYQPHFKYQSHQRLKAKR